MNAHPPPGYSLIEMLVVLTIAALFVGIVLVQSGRQQPAQRLQHALDEFAARSDAHCDGALFQGRARGIQIGPDGYRFWEIRDHAWEASGPLQPWPQRASLRASSESAPLPLGARPTAPQLHCGPLGERTPLMLELSLDGQQRSLAWNSAGARDFVH